MNTLKQNAFVAFCLLIAMSSCTTTHNNTPKSVIDGNSPAPIQTNKENGIVHDLDIDHTVTKQEQDEQEVKAIVDEFYRLYPDLKPVQPAMGEIFTEVVQANPGATKDDLPRLMEETAKLGRSRFGISSGTDISKIVDSQSHKDLATMWAEWFYRKYPELYPHHEIVGKVFMDVVSEMGQEPMENVMDTTADRTKSILRLVEETDRWFFSKYPQLAPYRTLVAQTFADVGKNNPNASVVERLDMTAVLLLGRLNISTSGYAPERTTIPAPTATDSGLQNLMSFLGIMSAFAPSDNGYRQIPKGISPSLSPEDIEMFRTGIPYYAPSRNPSGATIYRSDGSVDTIKFR